MTTPRWLAGAVGLALLSGGLTACQQDDTPSAQPSRSEAPQSKPPQSPTTSTSAISSGASSTSGSDQSLEEAESQPRQDPVYTRVGNPVVDALHYGLALDWSGSSGILTSTEELTFRAAEDSDTIPLDFSSALDISRVSLDGAEAEFLQKGADLFVKKAVQKDQEYVLTLEYAGTPRPAPAPTTRGDFNLVGWQSDLDNGTSYTMQEPYGAFTWYAVNDQPSDKAFYDIAVTTPQDLTGVANGTLESNRTSHGKRTTRWHLGSPAASYLVTVATGRYAHLEAKSKSGVPLQVWAPPDNQTLNDQLVRMLTKAVDWDEAHLGPLPFDSLGLVVVDMNSAMETQTMLTLGSTEYTLSAPVITHESIHQWYGDTVSPKDWRDVWMNEGMTMYLQWCFQADTSPKGITTIDSLVEEGARNVGSLVKQGGPPADYDPSGFGLSNIYVVPAVMWHRLREKLGDREFWRLVKQWPQDHRWSNADYHEITSWWSQKTGLHLQPYFDSWLKKGTPAQVP
jgi:aminopeptidase N